MANRKICEYDKKPCRDCDWCIVKERPWLFERATYNEELYGVENIREMPVKVQKTLDKLF